MPSLEVDVAVVGASSAGLYAAWHLAQAGRRVAVFEREEPWNPARRTLIITPYMNRLLPFPVQEAVLHKTPIMAVSAGEISAEITFREPDLIVERGALLRLLAQKAQAAGVAFHFDHRLAGVERAQDGTAVLLFHHAAKDGTTAIRARAIIGADGVFSDVARLVGIPRPPNVPILQAEVALPQGWDPRRVQVWFDPRETRFFYWLIPESNERGVVGLVGDVSQNVRSLLIRFLQRLDLAPEAYQGARVAMHHPRLRPWGQVGKTEVLLVGDAAGQVKVTTVGGTVTGLWGARLAARALIEGQPYAKLLRPLKRELDLHWLLRVMLDRLSPAGYEALVKALSPRVRAFLGRYTRDEMAGRFWQLVVTAPSLWRVVPHILRGPVHKGNGASSAAVGLDELEAE